MLTAHDRELARLARERRHSNIFPWRVNFDRLFRETSFIADMTELLRSLQDAYQNPVDVEFTANFVDNGSYLINLVQCRPLQVEVETEGHRVQAPENLKPDEILLESSGPVIGRGLATEIDRVVYVVPAEYAKLSVQERYAVAQLIGQVTHLED